MPILSLELTGLIPSKKNGKVWSGRSKRLFSSSRYQQWHKHAENEILHQKYSLAHDGKWKFPVMKCDSVTVTLYYGDMRRCDNSNKVESVHDLLVDTGILADDCWQVTGPTRQIPMFRKGAPGATVLIEARQDQTSS